MYDKYKLWHLCFAGTSQHVFFSGTWAEDSELWVWKFLSNISETHVTQQLSFESQANLIFFKISSLLKQSDPYIEWQGVSGTD